MSWLKSARSLRGITSKELAEMVGKSQIYIQKIEGGEKPLPKELEESIYGALGFSPSEVPFDTARLLLDLAATDTTEEETVYLGYVLVGKRVYFNSVLANIETQEDEDRLFAGTYLPIRSYFAEVLLESQLSVWG